jgi:hypothetical protein
VIESLASAVRRRIRASLANGAGNGTAAEQQVANGGQHAPENGEPAGEQAPPAPPEAGHEQV